MKSYVASIKAGLYRYRYTGISALLCGILTHMPAFTEKFINADDVYYMFSKGAGLDSGRWMMPIVSVLFPDISMPWFNGVVTLILLSVAACLIAAVFGLKRPVVQALWGGILTAFPALTATFGYMFTAPAYALALLLIALGLYAVQKKTMLTSIAACILFTLSFGIYQAYLSFVACFFCLLLIKEFLFGTAKTKTVYLYALRLALVALAAGLLYIGINQLVMTVFDVSYNAYAQENLQSDLTAVQRVAASYKTFLSIFRHMFAYIPTAADVVLYAVGLGGTAVLLVPCWLRMRGVVRKITVCGLVCLFPLCVSCLCLFVNHESIHSITQYAFVTVFILILTAVEQGTLFGKLRRDMLCKSVVTVAVSLILASQICFANEVYEDYRLRSERTASTYEQIVSQIEAVPGFTEGKKVAIVGRMRWKNEMYGYFAYADELTGPSYTVPGMYSWREYLTYCVGLEVPFATNEEIAEIQALPAFADMPCFPYHGSVTEIGGYIVVKLSDPMPDAP